MSLLFTTTVGLLSGIVGTGLGGLISITLHHSQAALGWLLGFSGGLMFAVVARPPHQRLRSGRIGVGAGRNAPGLCLDSGLDFLLRKLKPIASQHATSFLLALGVAIHDFAEGLRGAGFLPPPVWALAWPL